MKAWGILGTPTKEQIKYWQDLPYGEFNKMINSEDFGSYKITFYKIIKTTYSSTVNFIGAKSDYYKIDNKNLDYKLISENVIDYTNNGVIKNDS